MRGVGKDILDDEIGDNDGGPQVITRDDCIDRFSCSQLDCCCDDAPLLYGGNNNADHRDSGWCNDWNCGEQSTPGAGNSLSVSVF